LRSAQIQIDCNKWLRESHGSDRFRAAFTRADADDIIQWHDKDLAVADLAFVTGSTTLDDRFDGRFDKFVVDDDLKFYLSNQVDLILMATINLRVALLRRKTSTLESDSLTASSRDGCTIATIYFIVSPPRTEE